MRTLRQLLIQQLRKDGQPHLRQRGVIILETLVAISVISTAVLAGLVAMSTASIATEKGSSNATAAWIEVSQTELIRVADYEDIGDSYESVNVPAGYTVENETSEYYPGVQSIQRVLITVSKGGEVIRQKEIIKVER